MIFVIMSLVFIAILVLCLVFLVRRFKQLSFMRKLSENKPNLFKVAGFIPVAIVVAISLINAYVGIIGMLHLIAFWALSSFIAKCVRKLTKKNFGHDFESLAAVLVTIVYLSKGWYMAHHIYETSYMVKTEKNIGTLRIAQIADSHIGITLDGESFTDELERIQKTNPDVLMFTGDFVDDDSSKSDMIKACEALGNFSAPYGVYYVFGNHDKSYFSETCDYSEEELREELTKNNVVILEDDAVLVDDRFYIIGRQDKSERTRAEMSELVEGLDKDKYMIVLDHQPNDYDNEAEAGVDLVLSGHTHGGHIFPAGLIGLLIGANDKVYGMERIDGTDFIVTSGISGWAIPIKTGTISEYVVIDIITT